MREAQVIRAVNYTKGASESKDADTHSEELRAGVEKMYRRVDKQALLESSRLSKKDKRAFLAAGDPTYSGSIGGGYNAHLINELFNTIRSGGLLCLWGLIALGLWGKK